MSRRVSLLGNKKLVAPRGNDALFIVHGQATRVHLRIFTATVKLLSTLKERKDISICRVARRYIKFSTQEMSILAVQHAVYLPRVSSLNARCHDQYNFESYCCQLSIPEVYGLVPFHFFFPCMGAFRR